MEPLDNPVWHALCGPQATLAEGSDGARRFRPEFGPFAALADDPSEADWAALAEVVGTGGRALLVPVYEPPSGWQCLGTFAVRQMILPDSVTGALVDTLADVHPDGAGARVERLGPADADAMGALVASTDPGPWSTRTHELGDFVGIRVDGRLVAMAGQRMRIAGATELSAVCTDPAHRGHGYARAVVTKIAAVTADEGTVPFLHVVAENTAAIALYEDVGFRTRTILHPGMYQAPAG